MVKVFLRGGLGNQMFQYAAGLALARRNGAEPLLDTTFLKDRLPRAHFTYRDLALGVFKIEPRLTFLSRAANALPIPGLWLGLDVLGIGLGQVLGVQKLVKEKNAGFDPTVLSQKGNVLLWGYWQNEKYFKDIEPEIRESFRLRTEPTTEIVAQIRQSGSVACHVRRGDYTNPKTATFMAMIGPDYYARAAEYVCKRVENAHMFVFSDEPEWCKENLKFQCPATYVPAGEPAADMYLMSLAEHNIIANSSFSWWGAWLNANPQKIVVAPEHWYAKGASDQVVPENWIKL